MSVKSSMTEPSFVSQEYDMRAHFAQYCNMPILRLSVPSETGLRSDIALVVQDPRLWSTLVCAPGEGEDVTRHRAEALDILEGKRDPVPTDAGEEMRRDLAELPLVVYELFMLGDAGRAYERNEDHQHRFMEDRCKRDNRKGTWHKAWRRAWRPNLREVILLGLEAEDRDTLSEMWPQAAPLRVLHTMQCSPRFDEVVARHCLDECSFDEFQWIMWKLGQVVWDGLVLAVPTRQQTLPGKLYRVPDEIRIVFWGSAHGEGQNAYNADHRTCVIL